MISMEGLEKRRNKRRQLQVFAPCVACGKKRWTGVEKGQLRRPLCRSCAGKSNVPPHHYGAEHPGWKGGRIRSEGYVMVLLPPDHPFRAMAGKKGYVMEHRLVMAQKLGRCLESCEKVHHRDGERDNNEESNLALRTAKTHPLLYSQAYKEGYNQAAEDIRQRLIKVEGVGMKTVKSLLEGVGKI